jgi:hypothetical protein
MAAHGPPRRVDAHLVTSNGANADWAERVHLGTLSRQIALDFAELPRFADSASFARLFTDGWRLDYRSPIVRGSHAACESELHPKWP